MKSNFKIAIVMASLFKRPRTMTAKKIGADLHWFFYATTEENFLKAFYADFVYLSFSKHPVHFDVALRKRVWMASLHLIKTITHETISITLPLDSAHNAASVRSAVERY